MTLRQFEADARRRCLAEYPGLTGAEYDASYPAGSRRHEWIDAAVAAARGGHTFRRAVLDDLCRRAEVTYWHIYKHHPACVPAGYLPPATRAWNAAHEADMRAARRRGRGGWR